MADPRGRDPAQPGLPRRPRGPESGRRAAEQGTRARPTAASGAVEAPSVPVAIWPARPRLAFAAPGDRDPASPRRQVLDQGASTRSGDRLGPRRIRLATG